jgi:hypothetical protein
MKTITLNKKNIKKFYTGAEHIARAIMNGTNDTHTHATMEEAVRNARMQLEDQPTRDGVIIVKIVAVVRRKEMPIVVEKL